MTDQEIAAIHPLDLFRDDERALIEKRITETFELGDASVEATLIAKDGHGTPFLFTGKRIERGGIVLLIGMGLDITEQREILRVTSKLLRRNQTLMKSSMEGIYVLDAEGNVVEANDAFCNMLGYTPSEMSQLNVADWNVQWSAEELRAKISELIGNSAALETVQRCKDGHLIDVELCMTGVDLEGESYLFVASRDITERQKIQSVLQRHHQVIETAMDGFWMTSDDGILEEVNEAYVWLSGYTRSELIGMHISELEANERPEDVAAHLKKIFEHGQDRFETRHRRKNGEVYDIEISVTFMENIRKVFVFAHDISQRKSASLALQHNQELLNEAQRLAKLGSWEMIFKTGVLHWSDEVYRIFQLDPSQAEISYDLFMRFVHPRDREMIDKAYERSLLEKCPYDIEHRLLLSDDSIKWVREHCITEFDEAGEAVRSVGMVQDITEQKNTQEALRIAAATFESHDAILITDARSRILNVNRAFTEVTGYSLEEVIGKNPRIMSSGRHDHNFYIEMWQQLQHVGSWSGEIWDKRKDGDIYPKWMTITAVKNDRDEITQYVAIFSDITERKRAEEEIRVLAFYDPLTRLPNRRLFLDRLRVSLPGSARRNDYGAVLFLDMDRFKTLNDTLGHEFGDLMLIEVAQRLKLCVREMDTVARLGGDEFVVLIEGADDDAQNAAHKVGVVAEKIRTSLAKPYHLKAHEHHSSPSIGVTLFHGTESSPDELLRRADLAMYQAKSNGRNAVRFFDPTMQANVEQHEAIENDLRHAAERGELHLYYQLQVDNALNTIGAEALIRWQHPRRGMVSPAQFIPVAEESSLILDIGHWVLETACRQLACWQRNAKMQHLSLAVNISARQFRRDDLVDIVAAMLIEHGIKPSLLKLELTESVVLGDVADVVKKMHALKALGIQLSLDDFGTGYSSLSYLKKLPLDQIKIDQSFVQDIVSDANDAVMVKTIIDMATNFRLNVIAEGVETEAQFTLLKQHNCMAYQGYLFSKPVPLTEFETLVQQKI
ncbi:MAG: EAL domain-containing protein [Gallionella sp.]|nr:EAL domain-containing protein [Gallionella sp.]